MAGKIVANGLKFVDVFAGCGGLSLGLERAGWECMVAIEKDQHAFQTYRENLLDNKPHGLRSWPSDVAVKPWDISCFRHECASFLENARGKVDLLAGGPPCQGFSHAGRRQVGDPRNSLFLDYLSLVADLKPKAVLIENVKGFTADFGGGLPGAGRNFAAELRERLEVDYRIADTVLMASDFGVPQARARFFLVGVRRDLGASVGVSAFFEQLHARAPAFLASRGLTPGTSARDALSDLEVDIAGKVPCPETSGYLAIAYKGPRSRYQSAMNAEHASAPSDTRLARHAPEIVARFADIIRNCAEDGRLNRSISKELRDRHGLRKMALRVLDPLSPAPTITSMPDDLLHYREPRTLTVRENARLQSFPDWFQFKGKFTTGGLARRREIPRFTQVANAVPPLLAEQIGACLAGLLHRG
jgi:DNA (cytosine-5)-methyltransferase 1